MTSIKPTKSVVFTTSHNAEYLRHGTVLILPIDIGYFGRPAHYSRSLFGIKNMVRTRSKTNEAGELPTSSSSAADATEITQREPGITPATPENTDVRSGEGQMPTSSAATPNNSVAPTSPTPTANPSAATEERNTPLVETLLRTMGTTERNKRFFFYRGERWNPIAYWPGYMAAQESVYTTRVPLQAWMAEQRSTVHKGPYIDADDDLLALSSDEEDDGTTYSMPLHSVFDPEIVSGPDPHQTMRTVYHAQCMIGVVERYIRYKKQESVRYALQLVRIAHAHDGSGPSRAVIRDLCAAQKNNGLFPVVELAAKKLFELCIATLEEPRESLLTVYARLRGHIDRIQPFNGIMNSPESIYVKPTRYVSNPPSPTHGERIRRELMGPPPEPAPSLLGYRHHQYTPSAPVSMRSAKHTPTSSYTSEERNDGPSQSALSLAALRDHTSTVKPIATIYPHRLPTPIPALTTKHLQEFLREAELYEQRTCLTLPRHSIGNAEIRAAITLLWEDNFQSSFQKSWDDSSISWKQLIKSLSTRLSADNSSVPVDEEDPLTRVSLSWQSSWEFFPVKVGLIYTAEASLNMALDEAQLSPDQVQQITPELVRMIVVRARFRELLRLWDWPAYNETKVEVLRQRFFPTYTKDATLKRWWSDLRQRVQAWQDYHVMWRKALNITDENYTYRVEGGMLGSKVIRSPDLGRQSESDTSPRPIKKQRIHPPSSSTDKKAQTSTVPEGHITASKCRYCRQAKVTDKNMTHPKYDCPNFPYTRKKKDKDHDGMTPIAHHMCANNLVLPIANIFLQNQNMTLRRDGKALLDSGANANFIHPTLLGECADFKFNVTPTNTPLALALNTAETIASPDTRGYLVSSSVEYKVDLSKNYFSTNSNYLITNKNNSNNTTLRLLINHLNTDETQGSGVKHSHVTLTSKVTIHLGIESSRPTPVYITCDAYVANIRYPLILGYPTLMQYDLFRKLPHLWSPNYPSELSMDQKLGDDAERLIQRREVEGSERCLANTLAQDLIADTPLRSDDVEVARGDSMTAWEARVVDDHTGTSVHTTAIDASSGKWNEEVFDPTAYPCELCNVRDSCFHKGCGTDKAGEVSCLTALDDKPEHLFLAHLYSHDSIPKVVDISLNNMTIGTLESSNKHHNFTSRSPREWEDIEDIDDTRLDAIPAEMLEKKADNRPTADRVSFQGPPSLKEELHRLASDYADIFSSSVNPTPANIEPFRMKVDESKWQVPANGSGIRRMDKTRQDALKIQIDDMLRLGVIRESRAGYYSHGFLVPKKNGKWRLVIDYKNLNKATERVGWPIPNIQDLLARIGEQKPKYFGVMDLTSGYHQAPIHTSCQKYTAFLTPFGLYEWVRLPMGLAGAPSYFQRVMCTEVLAGLHAVVCFLYLDDLIVTGRTEEEFLTNMGKIFQRLREKGITLNPEKCVLGAGEVEYVGHTLNSTGLHFERSKLDSILEWEKPTTQKQLKRFLGVVNWFRDHVKNHSIIVKPLNQLIRNYSKSLQIKWSEEAITAFEEIKRAVHECPLLYFLDDTSPIFMETDASQYGIGASLYQRINDTTVCPIAFISKAFDERMMRWDTAQKEGYAIYYALIKWEHLLRDRKFTILTDHRNLRYLRDTFGHLGKVQRWLACFQSFDFELVHLAGEKNVVADGLSRCCSPPPGPEQAILAHVQVPHEFWTQIAEVHNSYVGHFSYTEDAR